MVHKHDVPEVEANLRRLQKQRRASSVQQNHQHDDNTPVERTRAAQLLSGWCFEMGIPTNSMQSSKTPRQRPASVNDRVPGTRFDYNGNLIPNDYMKF